jgi:hypothetical protein
LCSTFASQMARRWLPALALRHMTPSNVLANLLVTTPTPYESALHLFYIRNTFPISTNNITIFPSRGESLVLQLPNYLRLTRRLSSRIASVEGTTCALHYLKPPVQSKSRQTWRRLKEVRHMGGHHINSPNPQNLLCLSLQRRLRIWPALTCSHPWLGQFRGYKPIQGWDIHL